MEVLCDNAGAGLTSLARHGPFFRVGAFLFLLLYLAEGRGSRARCNSLPLNEPESSPRNASSTVIPKVVSRDGAKLPIFSNVIAKTRGTSSRYENRPRYGKANARELARERYEKRRRLSYWEVTRRPLPCLAFITPFLLAYEFGVVWLGGRSPEALRTGADAWVRRGLAALGLTDHWLLPLCLLIALLAWQSFSPRDWKFSPYSLIGMALESGVLGLALVGLSRAIDLGFGFLDQQGSMTLATPSPGELRIASLVGFLGAGVYEEALFRLTLIPLFYLILRALQTPKILAASFAITASALLFSLAHHAGMPGEAFTWFAFVFRWFAGIFFAWVFVVRGFGIAVGAHTVYDVLVGWLGWHF